MTVRHIDMRTRAVTVLAAAVFMVGCGQQAGETGASGGVSGSTTDSAVPAPSAASDAGWRSCTAEAFESDPSPALQLPVGDLPVEAVKLPTDGPCAGGLVVRTAEGVIGTDVSGLELEPDTADVVHLRGDGLPSVLLRVDGGRHPRGGFQPHLFAVTGTVGELTVDGQPLLPFVATDGGMAPMTATCTDDGGVAVLTATVSKPPGIVLAWDVERTAYRIDGTEARSAGSRQVRDHAADPVLRREMPDLFEPASLFADC